MEEYGIGMPRSLLPAPRDLPRRSLLSSESPSPPLPPFQRYCFLQTPFRRAACGLLVLFSGVLFLHRVSALRRSVFRVLRRDPTSVLCCIDADRSARRFISERSPQSTVYKKESMRCSTPRFCHVANCMICCGLVDS